MNVALGGRPVPCTWKTSKPRTSVVSRTVTLTRASGIHAASCAEDGVRFSSTTSGLPGGTLPLSCSPGWAAARWDPAIPAATPIATATATRNVCLDILRLLSRCVDGAVRSRRPCEHRPNSGERTGGDRVRDGRTRQTPVCPDCEPDATFTRPDKSMPLRRAPGVTGRHRRIASPSGRHHDVAIGAVALRRGAVHQGIGRTTVVAS